MTEDQRKRCHKIIHTASASAAGIGAGLAQIPGSDNSIITPIQLSMTIALGRVFGIDLSESTAKAAIGSVAAASIGRSISQLVLGWIPGLGNIVNATTAAGITESLGWILANEFSKTSDGKYN